MNEKKYYVKDMNKDLKRARRKQKIKELKNKVMIFVRNNHELIMLVAPSLIGTTVLVLKKGIRTSAVAIQEANKRKTKELFVYDRSLGHYWELKKKLTNRDWVEINRRKSQGEKLGDILSSMKVLK